MKVRLGFVTNSSSSSYICAACGRAESGMDLDIADVYMCVCENGHEFCDDCLPEGSEFLNEDSDMRYNFPSEHCPVCNLILIPDYLISSYIKKISTITEQDVLASIKKQNPRRKKVYDTEYVNVALQSLDTTRDQIIFDIKQYETYDNLMKFIRQR